MQLTPESEHLGSWSAWFETERPLRLGVSSCLLGEEVRYDGGHKRDDFVADTLGGFVEYVRVCPEVELGMGIPRPSIRLVQDEAGSTRLLDEKNDVDWTERMQEYARAKCAELAALDLDGYVLKKASPSCGLLRMRVFRSNGHAAHRDGQGLFARELVRSLPELPVEEDGRLNDPRLRETFVERVFTRARWRRLLADEPGPRDLVAFHTAHKLLLLAHDEATYRRMGRVVAVAGDEPFDDVLERYGALLHGALARPSSTRRHINVLQHVLGHFKEHLAAGEKRALLDAIDEFARGHVPLAVPVALLHFQVERCDVAWLRRQLYFDPYPKDFLVRSKL